EFGRSQRGNNNAYCQDNEISWFDWTLAQKNAELVRFTRECVAFRKENPVFRRDRFFRGLESGEPPEEADILWFDESGGPVNWHASDNPLACRIHPRENDGIALYLMFNPTPVAVMFSIPPGQWISRIDTAAQPPDDIMPLEKARRVVTGKAVLTAFSLMVLSANPKIR
ncbi:MAG TPA: glycogen debranching enzyme, partial [Candidatus Hydrogenedentes bacterium]|nr:glycogen debranching enzyme [Candidatus Hydrogenedentota bacterium]